VNIKATLAPRRKRLANLNSRGIWRWVIWCRILWLWVGLLLLLIPLAKVILPRHLYIISATRE
jgi:hypothetical protein